MIALALLLATGQAAPPASAPVAQSEPTVVVTGRRPDEAKVIRHMTTQVTPLGDASQPLPRFAAPICPDVGGLPAAYAQHFVERMRADAKTAALDIDRAGCAPNVTVLFVPNGQEVVKALRRKQPLVFGNLDSSHVRRLVADAGPVHVWSLTELRSRDGDQLRAGVTTGIANAPEMLVRDASIIVSPTHFVVDGAIILIDQPAAIGKTINQLADYAVMRTLAQARPTGGETAEPTILRLFDRGEPSPPPALTEFDAAYLRAMYQGQPTQLPITKIGLMARAINKSLATTPEADKPGR